MAARERTLDNKPVRADYLDTVVWDHITALLADPALIRAEISKRLEQARTTDPVTRQRRQIEQALAKAGTSITAMIEAYSEQLITIDELRARMPDLRAREANLKSQLGAALDTQAADRDAYLRLADDLEGFLARLRGSTAGAWSTAPAGSAGVTSTLRGLRRSNPGARGSTGQDSRTPSCQRSPPATAGYFASTLTPAG